MRFTEKDDFLGYAIPQTNAVGDKQINIALLGKNDNLDEASVTVICQNYIVGEPIRQFGRIEDVLGKHDVGSAEELDLILEGLAKVHQENANLKNELAELKQKAIVLPFEFDKPIYKLCPKCNDRQTDCKNCAWGGCGFNQCYDICHKENKGQIICEVIFKKDNCNVSWNALRFISEHWGEYYFATKEEAEQSLLNALEDK